VHTVFYWYGRSIFGGSSNLLGKLRNHYSNLSRKAQQRQTENDEENFQYNTRAAAGLFHMQLAVLVLLFTTHMGDSLDTSSFTKWMDVLSRDDAGTSSPVSPNSNGFFYF
jgi:hypothetical protein